jgi:hypothetical protein
LRKDRKSRDDPKKKPFFAEFNLTINDIPSKKLKKPKSIIFSFHQKYFSFAEK